MPKTRASHSFWNRWSKAGIDVCVGGRGAAVFGAVTCSVCELKLSIGLLTSIYYNKV